MNILLLTIGILIQLLVIIDMFKTIIYFDEPGFLAGMASKNIWRFFFWMSKGNGKSKLLTLCGPLILLFFLFMWVTLIWIGYSLIYISDPDSVIETTSQSAAGITGKFYYVGYTLTSLGNGGYSAKEGIWQIVSNIMGLNSMVFISLGISYLLPVLQAVIDKRALALQIAMLGRTPEEIIKNGYNDDNFNSLYQRFANLESLLIKHSERHLAYPILHYFHSNDKLYALPLRLAALDEAMVIQNIYNLDSSEKNIHWKILGQTLDKFYERLGSEFITEADQMPVFDYSEALSEEFSEHLKINSDDALSYLEDRRKKVLGYVKSDGWTWQDVISAN